jgi:eukaryotic-like serine/threonine-protein kinase
MIGRTLAHYQVVEKIGEGGMGVLYRARDARLGRDVAIKILRPDAARDPARTRRLLQEARAASALNHPHIVTVYDVGLAPLDGQDVAFIAMECVEGRSLRQEMAERRLGQGEILDYAVQIAEALAVAHAAGVVHRDLKPANLMIGTGGRVKVLDFGLAEMTGPDGRGVDGPTVSASDDTGASEPDPTPHPSPAGTAAYMSPEQADGRRVDARSDVFSLGIVLYEMLAGRRPFQGQSYLSLASAILRDSPLPLRPQRTDVPPGLERIVKRCLAKSPEERYAGAGELLLDLVACRARVAARSSGWRAAIRQPRYLVPGLLTGLSLCLLVAWTWSRGSSRRWAEGEALPEIDRLVASNRSYEAYWLARDAAAHLPDHPRLDRFWKNNAFALSLRTDPPGAEVEVKSYRTPETPWRPLGRTPLEDFPMPPGMLRWRIAKEGFETVDATFAPGGPSRTVHYTLDALGSLPPGMVRVPGGHFEFRNHPPVDLQDFWLDRYEVTNRDFKAFVDQGGYLRTEYWKQPYVRDGRTLTRDEAMRSFQDATGRPGPATWELGAFPDGQGDHPVGGISWFEAAAYAEFAGKALPTLYHWYKATDLGQSSISADILELSNFGGKGAVSVGSLAGTSPYGSSDMAGNVREWTASRSARGQYILGGSWNEPAHSYIDEDRASPWSRLPINGFRCVRYTGAAPVELPKPAEWAWRNYAGEKPASDEAFQTYRSFFAYDRTDLRAAIDAVEETEHWRRETVSFDAAYGHERVPAHLFLPRNAQPPYQTVVFYPTGAAFFHASSDRIQTSHFDYLVRSGRAVLHPVYQGTYERRSQVELDGPNAYRDLMVQQVKDFRRAVDYLETRGDIDHERLAAFAISGFFELYVLALDERIRVGVAHAGGLSSTALPAEIDPINFAPRVRQPFLLVNGRFDSGYPVDLLQKPLLRLLGTPEKDQRLVLVESGHSLNRSLERVRETIDWLDRYLGPVGGGAPAAASRETTPPFITNRTRSTAVMSASGSPGTATRSASFPASTVPSRSLQPRMAALREVAATSAAMGASPVRTRTASSRAFLPCGTTPASVPRPIGRPAASARRKPASCSARICRSRSCSAAGTVEPSATMTSLVASVGT